MPEFSLHLPRLLRFRRSRSRSSQPSLPCLHDDTGTPHSSGSRTSPASSSRPLSDQALDTGTGTSCLSPLGHPVDPRTSAGHLFVDRVPGNFGSHPSWEPQPTTSTDVGAVAQQPIHLTSSSNFTDSAQAENRLSPQPGTYSLPTPSQQSLNSGLPSQSSSKYLPQPQHQSLGMFYQAENFSAKGNFIHGNVTYNNVTSTQFMKELLEKTIPGAEFDSSARDPPPRCHPGTRLAILERCLCFISNCEGVKKVRWVVGAAGVGKSAIMQNVAESPELPVNYHASVFFSINGRNDGTKAVLTISYQLAAKSDSYRQVIEREVSRDPSLLRSSMAKQFNKLIVEPFIHNPQLKSAGRVLIIIDGLDECNDPHTQQELLRLISDLCITYPSSPLVWLIASRPEPHITSFFSKRNVITAYEKEEIPVNSDEARADVEQFLRAKLMEIQEASDSLDPQWPEERDFWKLANAAGGLFAYAHTVIRYIGDSTIGSPISQLSDVLYVIDNHPMTGLSREEHPMALLDALYERILSKVPSKIMILTRKLLLSLASDWDSALRYPDAGSANFIILCNWLGMTPGEAYAAVNHLRSVLHVPRRDKAHEDLLRPFHKSFIDYISDFTRSGFSPDVLDEARQLGSRCAFRILKEAPDGIHSGDVNYRFHYGFLARGPGTGEKISLTWLVGESGRWNDRATRLRVYKMAIGAVVAGIERGNPTFQTEFCIRLLTARFEQFGTTFAHHQLGNLVFDGSRRPEFMMHGILKKMPLEIVKISQLNTFREVKLRFRRPATTAVTGLSNPWNSSCKHQRKGDWVEKKDQDWWTTFWKDHCVCFDRLEHELANRKAHSPDHTVLVLFTSTDEHCVEFRFVDPKDGMSEWTYWFWLRLSWEEGRKYRSIV